MWEKYSICNTRDDIVGSCGQSRRIRDVSLLRDVAIFNPRRIRMMESYQVKSESQVMQDLGKIDA